MIYQHVINDNVYTLEMNIEPALSHGANAQNNIHSISYWNYRSYLQVHAYKQAAVLRPLMHDYIGREIQYTSVYVHRPTWDIICNINYVTKSLVNAFTICSSQLHNCSCPKGKGEIHGPTLITQQILVINIQNVWTWVDPLTFHFSLFTRPHKKGIDNL